jgi:hypothetical protein
VKDVDTENYKSMMKYFEKNTNELKAIPCSCTGRYL